MIGEYKADTDHVTKGGPGTLARSTRGPLMTICDNRAKSVGSDKIKTNFEAAAKDSQILKSIMKVFSCKRCLTGGHHGSSVQKADHKCDKIFQSRDVKHYLDLTLIECFELNLVDYIYSILEF